MCTAVMLLNKMPSSHKLSPSSSTLGHVPSWETQLSVILLSGLFSALHWDVLPNLTNEKVKEICDPSDKIT